MTKDITLNADNLLLAAPRVLIILDKNRLTRNMNFLRTETAE